jgi:hypothetical protein
MKVIVPISVGVGLALAGCAVAQPGSTIAEIAPAGPPTPLVPQPSASAQVARLPAAAYPSGPRSAPNATNPVMGELPYHPHWTVWIAPYSP